MTSKKVEDVHVNLLNRLLSKSGLECTRSPQVSLEYETLSGETEAQGPTEEEETEQVQEEVEEQAKAEIVEEIAEEISDVFPTPSLRRLLPEKIRKVEEQNRIHVLPEVFKTEIDPAAIPKIAQTAPQKYIDILAELLGCTNYKSSMAEFWFLDTLANLLRRAQEDDLSRPTQAVFILWFCEWMKEIQHFDAADRLRMLRRFQDNMLAAAKFVSEEDYIPNPAQVGVFYKAPDNTTEGTEQTVSSARSEPKQFVSFEGAAYECSLRDLTKIIHYIFDLFSSDYQYNLVRSVFTFTPDYIPIDFPYQLQNPKRLYAPLKIKPKKDKPAKKGGMAGKGRKKEVLTEEFIALMELKAQEERQLDEQELRDMEAYNLRSHILPLSFAATDELFDKYWPPPSPEPEPEPEPEPKKGKGKKK